jgi:LruC domain-containing protein
MKKIILITLLSLVGLFGYSQTVTNNFEDGNWLYYHNRCWGIGENNELEYFSTKVTGNGFNGTDVCETDNLGHTNICRLESPWIDLSAGNIEFDHAVPSKDGTRKLTVYIVKEDGSKTDVWSFTYTNGSNKHAVINNTQTGVRKIRWQWTGNGGNSRGQLDNIIIAGTNVSDPSNDCGIYIPPPPVNDSVVNYYPASDTSTLAFEDLWPNYGDYDMNDLVIGYKFKVVSYTLTHYVKNVYVTLIVRAQGAGLLNGFGFQLPINPNSIESVYGVGDQSGYSIGSNGTENNQTKAVFIIFDDSHKFMSSWNTIKGEVPCPQRKFNIQIKFSNTNNVTLSQLDIQNWNPFLVKNSVRGQEIHLPNYLPTDLADPTLFGTGDDDTTPGLNKYYKSKNNLPWAIDVYGKFNYPTETSDVSKAYLHFGAWAESNGSTYQDWWLNTNSGYRDTNLIY